ncbi:Serine carboxypeptidase II-3 [Hibiscus syriacus]|uniref:Serine carboxypeptidase II-3 n=1 Tax=Hibiscus syriacus TaxID=106335 RepID=A0A6A3BPW6_HIBSY|nr:Serine carboxypeptidase II-3 [Hibiscus syriacus]
MKVTVMWLLLLLPHCLPGYPISSCMGNQIENLNRLIASRRSWNTPRPELCAWLDDLGNIDHSPVYVGSQKGLMQADKIDKMPGQPEVVDFNQYAGYVAVDPVADRALFYYFVESPVNSLNKPLLLWLNGGPGWSSFGYGAMQELEPFRVNSDGKTLYRNEYAGDTDGRVPVTSSRYAIKTLQLPVETGWRPWYFESEGGGYVVGYKGVIFTTVRGAGHMVPSYQPERALTMITSFLQWKLPPS